MKLSKSYIVASALALAAGAANAGEHSKEWNFSTTKDGKKSEVSVTKCYSDESKSKMSFTWYPSSDSYDNSLTINCECNQNLKINDKILVRLDGLDSLVAEGLPVNFKSHMCVPAENAMAHSMDKTVGK